MSDKQMTSLSLAAAVAGAVALSAAATAVPSGATLAATPVKCYGIAKAGENDCANTKAVTPEGVAAHSCAGQSVVDYAGWEWKLVTGANAAQTCTEDLNGQLEAFAGQNSAYVEG